MKYLPLVRSFLLQPYPFSNNTRHKLAVCAGVGLFITIFLAVFKPFGFDELRLVTQWLHAALFGLVTFFVSGCFQALLPKVLPAVFAEEGWRSWKEIVYLLLTTVFIGAGNYFLVLALYPQDFALASFWRTQLITFEVGVFPIVFIVFLKQLTLYRRFAAKAREASEDIRAEQEAARVEPEASAPLLVLRGDNQKEEVSVSPADLLFLSSADNYVQVLIREGGATRSVLLRGTLKKMEEQLTDHPAFFRCHRMYLVNLQQVREVSGNAQGLKLHLAGLDEAVPVSRSLTETVRTRLHALSHSPRTA